MAISRTASRWRTRFVRNVMQPCGNRIAPRIQRLRDLLIWRRPQECRQPRYWSRSRRRTWGCLCSLLRPARGTTSSRISSVCIRSTERDAQTKTAASHAPIRLYDALRSRRAALGVACDECRPGRVHTALHDRCARSPLAFALAGHLRFTAQWSSASSRSKDAAVPRHGRSALAPKRNAPVGTQLTLVLR